MVTSSLSRLSPLSLSWPSYSVDGHFPRFFSSVFSWLILFRMFKTTVFFPTCPFFWQPQTTGFHYLSFLDVLLLLTSPFLVGETSGNFSTRPFSIHPLSVARTVPQNFLEPSLAIFSLRLINFPRRPFAHFLASGFCDLPLALPIFSLPRCCFLHALSPFFFFFLTPHFLAMFPTAVRLGGASSSLRTCGFLKES